MHTYPSLTQTLENKTLLGTSICIPKGETFVLIIMKTL